MVLAYDADMVRTFRYDRLCYYVTVLLFLKVEKIPLGTRLPVNEKK